MKLFESAKNFIKEGFEKAADMVEDHKVGKAIDEAERLGIAETEKLEAQRLAKNAKDREGYSRKKDERNAEAKKDVLAKEVVEEAEEEVEAEDEKKRLIETRKIVKNERHVK